MYEYLKPILGDELFAQFVEKMNGATGVTLVNTAEYNTCRCGNEYQKPNYRLTFAWNKVAEIAVLRRKRTFAGNKIYEIFKYPTADSTVIR